MSNRTNILWLSDIHFRGKYVSDENRILNKFIEGFRTTVFEIYNNPDKTLDYILITGDLAFSGTKADYDALKQLIIEPLISLYKDNPPTVLSIPGNHDVNWKTLPDWIFEGSTEDIVERFKAKNNKISAEFGSKTITQFDDFKKWQEDFLGKSAPSITQTIKDNQYLFGYWRDDSRKIIFVLLNSAWFSLGGGFDEKLKSITATESLDISQIIALKNNSVEFGGQIIGMDLLKDVNNILKEYPTYAIITTCHHPLHWLEWAEYQNYLGHASERLKFLSILSQSDIFLTGHEHVPLYVEPKKISFGLSHQTYHLQGGMFLQDYVRSEGALSFPHNRFSVLEISPESFYERCFLYSNESEMWKEKSFKTYNFDRFNKIDYSLKNQETIVAHFKANELGFIKNHAKNKLNREIEPIQVESGSRYCNFYTYKTPKKVYFWVVPLVPDFYISCIKKNDFIITLKSLLITTLGMDFDTRKDDVILTFFCLDLLVSNADTKEYEKNEIKEKGRRGIYVNILKKADDGLNKFRVKFFDERDNSTFSKLSEVKFSNVIQNFWF